MVWYHDAAASGPQSDACAGENTEPRFSWCNAADHARGEQPSQLSDEVLPPRLECHVLALQNLALRGVRR